MSNIFSVFSTSKSRSGSISLILIFMLSSLILAGCSDTPTSAPASDAAKGTATPDTNTGSGIVVQAIAGGQPLPTPTAPGPDQRKVLTIWTGGWAGNSSYENFLNTIIDSYSARDHSMTIDWQDWGDNLAAKFQEAASNPTKTPPPDLVLFDESDLYQFGAAGYLNDIIGVAGSSVKDDYSNAAFETMSYGSVYYGLPWTANMPVALINKTLWVQSKLDPTKPPVTLTDLDQDIPLMAHNTASNVIPVWYKPNALVDFMMEDAPIFNISGDGKTRQAAFPSPGTTARWQYYKDKIYKQGGVIDKAALTDSSADLLKKYQAGNLVMVIDGGAILPALKNASADLYKNTMVVTVPLGKAGTMPLNTQGWAISKASKQSTEALNFLKFLNTPDNQLAFAKLNSLTIPTLKKALSDASLQDQSEPATQARALMVANIEKGKAPAQTLPAPLTLDQRQKLLDALNQAQTAIWNNANTTPDSALSDAAKTWATILK